MSSPLVKKLAIGTVQFGLDYGITNEQGKTPKEEVAKILDFAAEVGIDTLDTAEAYGDSEEILGLLHDNRFNIVTKIMPNASKGESLRDSVARNMARLKVGKLYGVLFHSAAEAMNNPDAVKELHVLQEEGIVGKIGYSVYTPEELQTLLKRYKRPSLIQIPFSHLDQRFEELASQLHEEGVEIHSRSTFLQGLFFANEHSIQSFFDPIKPYLKELNQSFNSSADKAGFLLRFAASRPFINKVVIGINNVKQLKSNIAGLTSTRMPVSLSAPTVPSEILLPYLWK